MNNSIEFIVISIGVFLAVILGVMIGWKMNNDRLDLYFSGDPSLEIVTNNIFIDDGITNINVSIERRQK